MMVDAHVHIMPQRRLNGLSLWLSHSFPNHPLAGKLFNEDNIIKELQQKGVKYIFNLVYPMKSSETEELNLFNYHLNKKFKHIIPFGSLHVENEDKKAIVNRCVKELGHSGFKLHPYVQGFSPDDERLFPAYEMMEKFCKPIIIHTGFETFYPKRRKTITLKTMEDLIKRFSSLTFIASHMFYPELNNAVYLLETYDNVYLDTTNIFSAILQDEKKGIDRDREREILIKTLRQRSERMVFGTDHPAGMSDVDTILLDLNSFHLKNEIKQDIQFNTANHLLNLPVFFE